ncbi:MAG: methyltransferase [Candidatus Aenigmatarchaeota archaeon]
MLRQKSQEEVYAPAEDTWLLADVLAHERLMGKDVLEIGCGSGFLTKIIAKKGARVTAVDINPAAVAATKKILGEEKLDGHVFASDLFSNVLGAFDLIVFNPPYLPEGAEDAIVGSDARYSGGKTGREVIEKFVQQSKGRLKAGGKILLLISSVTGERDVISEFAKNGFAARPLVRRKIDWEELVVVEAVEK